MDMYFMGCYVRILSDSKLIHGVIFELPDTLFTVRWLTNRKHNMNFAS